MSLARLLDPSRVGVALAMAGHRPADSPPLALERAWPHPRHQMTVLFREASGPGPRWWTVAPLAPAPARHHIKAGWTHLPDLAAHARPFPRDPALPALPRILRPDQVAERLAPILARSGMRLRTVRLDPVAYKPSRRLVVRCQCAIEGSEPDLSLYLRALRPGEGRRIWNLQGCLRTARRDATGSGIALARAFLADWGVLVLDGLPGQPLAGLLRAPAAPADVARAGCVLAALHGAQANWPRWHGLEHERAVLRRWTTACRRACPDLGDLLEPATNHLFRLAARLPAGPLRPSHRDLHDKQVLVAGEAAHLLDLDTACRAEPELDLGNFIAHLRLRHLQGRGPEPARLVGAFLAGYRDGGGRWHERRLRFYEAATLLRLAAVYALRGQARGLSSDLAAEALARAREETGAAPATSTHYRTADSRLPLRQPGPRAGVRP